MAGEFIVHHEEVLQPSLEEFCNFPQYIAHLEKNYFDIGFAHIHAPPKWQNQWDDINSMDSNFFISPVIQSFESLGSGYLIHNGQSKPRKITVADYLHQSYRTEPNSLSVDDQESLYWSTLTDSSPLYAADIDYSFCKSIAKWNFNSLGSILDEVKTPRGTSVRGIHEPSSYIGSWKSSFGWHTEDHDLHSINMHLSGSPKVWYFVPREHGFRFDFIVSSMFPEYKCDKFLRHKMCIFGEQFFIDNKLQRIRVVQNPGEIIITFPYIFHSGFNCGVNFNEAVNFATNRWIDYGKTAVHCSCKPTKHRPSFHIKLDMDAIVKRLQPRKFDAWKNNREMIDHPDDPAAKEKRRLAAETVARQFSENVKHRVVDSLLSPEILTLYLRFVVENNVGMKSEKAVRKFRKYANSHHVKLPTLNDSTLLSRFMKQAYEPFKSGLSRFDLSQREISILRKKMKN